MLLDRNYYRCTAQQYCGTDTAWASSTCPAGRPFVQTALMWSGAAGVMALSFYSAFKGGLSGNKGPQYTTIQNVDAGCY